MRQAESPFEDTDATLDPRPPSVGTSKGGAMPYLFLGGREWALPRQGDSADAQVVRESIVVEGEERAVGSQSCGHLAKTRLMVCQAVPEFGRIWWIARQHRVARDQSTLHFVE